MELTGSLLVGTLILKSALWAANGSPKIPLKDFQAGEIKAGFWVDCVAIYPGAETTLTVSNSIYKRLTRISSVCSCEQRAGREVEQSFHLPGEENLS